MLLNIRGLLEHQGAGFKDIVYAFNYLKNPDDEALLKKKFKEAGEVLDITVLDHLILSAEGAYYSFADEARL